MRVAIDPGATTGFAWRAPDGSLRQLQIPGVDVAVVLNGLHQTFGVSEVVIENFRSRPGPAVNLSAPETIGRVEAWCDERGIRLVRQEVAGVKRRFNDDRLRAWGGWVRGADHARDAIRHLFYREEKLGKAAPPLESLGS